MAKSKSGSTKGGQSGSGNTGRGPSSHPGPGGNWPSATGNKSGNDRGVAPPKGK